MTLMSMITTHTTVSAGTETPIIETNLSATIGKYMKNSDIQSNTSADQKAIASDAVMTT